MEELVLMILRGLVIGVVVSAPMGPVGIYCIQRTLDKGRLSGLYTGVGAAVSDLIYCLLTGFGLSFIEDFINTHRSPIQLLGSIVLIFFGIWLIRKKPDGRIKAEADQDAPSREGDILKGFALTFSNPLILFLIIGLFAQFNFVIEGMKFYHYLLGFLGIIGGALGWWWLVTHFVDKLRGHFTQRTMKRINTVIGIIILIFAAVGIFSSTSGLMAAYASSHSPAPVESVEFRVADTSMKGWEMRLACGPDSAVAMRVRPVSKGDPFGDSAIDALSVRFEEEPSGRVLAEAVVSDGVDPYRGANAWRVVRKGSAWNVFCGHREYRHLIGFSSPLVPLGSPEVTASSPGGVAYSLVDVSTAPIDRSAISEADVFFALEGSGARAMDLPGVYSLLDFEQDDTYARIGGSYRVAVVPRAEGEGYDLRYMGGARENAAAWRPGSLKGRLRPTSFADLYDVEWCDAEGGWMLSDIQAEFDPMARTLTVKFPYQAAVIRFRKTAPSSSLPSPRRSSSSGASAAEASTESAAESSSESASPAAPA